MIEFHEDEHVNSVFSDDTLRIIARFVDRKTYDKLLYIGEKWYNISGASQARRKA